MKKLRADLGGRKNQKEKEVFMLGRLGFFSVNSTEFPALTQDDSTPKLSQEKGDFPANGQVEWPKKTIIVQLQITWYIVFAKMSEWMNH